jgi:hypothetical protein
MLESIRPVLCALVAFAGAAAAPAPAVVSPVLPKGTSAGWSQYVAATEQRIGGELNTGSRFLVLDFGPSAAADRQAIQAGQMPVAPMRSLRPDGGPIDVPDAWVHHWRGAVLVPGVTLDQVFSRLQAEVPGSGQGDVLSSSILARQGDSMHVFIKVRRQGRFVVSYSFVYNTEHDVTFSRRDALHGSSVSVATKIAEVDSPGTPGEREFRAGDDNGFLWRWNSYWRYEQVPAGVIAECESITLSRTAPFGTGWIANRIEESEAPAAMTRALVNLRAHFAHRPDPAGARGSLTTTRPMPRASSLAR